MLLSSSQFYKYEEIRGFLNICPLCGLSDDISLSSKVDNNVRLKCQENIMCGRCKLDISFTFAMDQDNEIIDEYALDYFKLGAIELRNNNDQLVLYLHNTYIQDIVGNIIDIKKYRKLSMLA